MIYRLKCLNTNLIGSILSLLEDNIYNGEHSTVRWNNQYDISGILSWKCLINQNNIQ